MSDKWKRIIISFAGIYVELIIAAASTWIWWYTPHWPFINNLALCLMVLCSISTFIFNANPLMRFDGYYILADWLEVPNLRERSSRYLSDRFQETCLGIEVTPEKYMAPWRRWFFIIYTIASTIYRWVLTVTILFFMAKWLKPYKLETLSILLALMALASQFGWPLFRLIRNTRKRGRLPDMKPKRVMITCTIGAALVGSFFFLPLPLNRVRETGLVEVQENSIAHVYVGEPGGFLMVQYVQDGDWVAKGKDLATFSNPQQEAKVAQLNHEVDLQKTKQTMLEAQLKQVKDSDKETQGRFKSDLANVRGKLKGTTEERDRESKMLEDLKVLRAPRDGMVMGAPTKEKQFRYWDKSEAERICSIGDPMKLRLLVPLSPPQYREVKENLNEKQIQNPNEQASLDVSILLANRSDKIYRGRITFLPDSHDTNVPVGLTSKGGGPLATKGSANPNVYEPVAQTYLVQVEVLDPDGSITPGTLGTVKIHLRWRSAAWWCGQKIATALDWGIW
jgi:putative peptide zinc metalloprotease protein